VNAAALALLLVISAQGENPGAAGVVKEAGLPGSLFIMELEARNLAEDEAPVAKTLGDLIATELSGQMTRKLITASEVKELVDVETQRAMTDCSNESCLAEIAGALDAGFVLFGSVTKVGTRFILNLSLADKTGVFLKRESFKAEDLNALVDGYPAALAPMIDLLEGREASTPAPKPESEPEEKHPILGLTVFGTSMLFAVVGGLAMWGSANVIGAKGEAGDQQNLADRRQMQLVLWGSTVTTGLAATGMVVGTGLVLGSE
jgi:TolB-like protein